MPHNIERALPGKPYAYRAWSADGTLFHVYRNGRRAWRASTPNAALHSYADTLRELSRQLSTLR